MDAALRARLEEILARARLAVNAVRRQRKYQPRAAFSATELVAIAALLHIEAALGELLPGAGDREPAPGGRF